MHEQVATALTEVLDSENIDYKQEAFVHHNYAALEHHYGKNVWVHRKGATSAKEGEIGLIPGSQGTCSYVVRGKGNPESFMSCSHGAGRTLARKQAKRTLDLNAEKKMLDDRGIIHSIRHQDDLDEAPSAYKDIDVVMENQKDLVDIVKKLEPLVVIKGNN
jgi:tRNA-splicing ligase RtcB